MSIWPRARQGRVPPTGAPGPSETFGPADMPSPAGPSWPSPAPAWPGRVVDVSLGTTAWYELDTTELEAIPVDVDYGAGGPEGGEADAPPTGRLGALRAHLRVPLFRTAYALIGSTVLTTGLGLAASIAAARLYSLEEVGRGQSAVNALVILSGLGNLRLMNVLTRFLPRARERSGWLVGRSYLLATVACLMACGVYLSLPVDVLPVDELLGDIPYAGVWFTVGVLAFALFTLQDAVLTGVRGAGWVPLENGIHSLVKLGLVVALAGSMPETGIFASWVIPTLLALVPINLLIVRRLLPANAARPVPAENLSPRRLAPFAAAEYAGALCELAVTNLIPLIVAAHLGLAAAGAFGVAWLIGTTLDHVVIHFGASLTVEGAADPAKLAGLTRQLLRRSLLLVGPIAAVVVLGAPVVLKLFGGSYANRASGLLSLLGLALVPRLICTVAVVVARVRNRVGAVVGIQALLAAGTLGATVPLLDRMGIAGPGLAYLVSSAVVALLVIPYLVANLRDVRHLRRPEGAAAADADAHVEAGLPGDELAPALASNGSDSYDDFWHREGVGRPTAPEPVSPASAHAEPWREPDLAEPPPLPAWLHDAATTTRYDPGIHQPATEPGTWTPAAAHNPRPLADDHDRWAPTADAPWPPAAHHDTQAAAAGDTHRPPAAQHDSRFPMADEGPWPPAAHHDAQSTAGGDTPWPPAARHDSRSPATDEGPWPPAAHHDAQSTAGGDTPWPPAARHEAGFPTAGKAPWTADTRREAGSPTAGAAAWSPAGDHDSLSPAREHERWSPGARLDSGFPVADRGRWAPAGDHGSSAGGREQEPWAVAGHESLSSEGGPWGPAVRQSRPADEPAASMWAPAAPAHPPRRGGGRREHGGRVPASPSNPSSSVVVPGRSFYVPGTVDRTRPVRGPEPRRHGRGHGQARVRDGRRVRAGWSLASLALGLALLAMSMLQVDRQDPGGALGLIAVLPETWWLGVAVLTAGFAWLVVVAPQRHPWLLAHLVLLILALHATPGLVEAHGRFPTAWTHVGFVDHVVSARAVDPGYDARYNWPGSFSFGGFLVELTGAESARSLVRFAPVAMNLLMLAPLALLARHISRDNRVRWVALWLAVLTNWVGQDYLAPQPLALLAYLAVVGVLLRWFRRANPRPASGLDLLGRLRRRYRSLVRDDRLSHTVAPAPPAGEAQEFGIVVVIACIGIIVAFSHQLTPFMLVIAAAVLVATGRVDRPLVPIILAVCAVAWVALGTTDYLRSNLSSLTSALGDVGQVVQDNQERVGPGRARQLILATRLVLTALVGGLALVGFWRQWRNRRADWALVGLVLAPAMLALLNSYGGEVLLRVSLFSLPFLALLGAFALVREGVGNHGARRIGVLLFGVSAMLLPLFVAARYGNESFERIYDDDIAAWDYLVEEAPEHATVVVPDFAGPWRYRALMRFEYRVFADEVGGGTVDATGLDRLVAASGDGPGYVVLGTGSARYRAFAEGYRPGWTHRVTDELVGSGRYEVVFESGETRVLRRTLVSAEPLGVGG